MIWLMSIVVGVCIVAVGIWLVDYIKHRGEEVLKGKDDL